jgi:competence protein ComEC
VDKRKLKHGGAHALYIDGLSIRTDTVTDARGQRPWTRRADTPAPRAGGKGSLL